MTMIDLSDFINKKIEDNPNEIIFTFYELRVKCNLTEEETYTVVKLCENKFKNIGYRVYLTGEEFTFRNEHRKVESNELFVAVKD